jgi:hypothetical protein
MYVCMYVCVCVCMCVSSLIEFVLDLQNMHVIQLIPDVIQSTAIQNQCFENCVKLEGD